MNRFIMLTLCAGIAVTVVASSGLAQTQSTKKLGAIDPKSYVPLPSGSVKASMFVDVASRIVVLTNQERAKAGLKPLRNVRLLDQVAQAHAANMAKQRKMSHTLDNLDAAARLRKAGYKFGYWGENIASNYATAEDVVRGWMNSPGHRQNILNPNFTEIGVGLAKSANGEPYYCQVFASPQ